MISKKASVSPAAEFKTANGNIVASVGSFDVLLGRGTGPSMNQGNVLFRETVEDLKASYISTPSRKEKKQIVHKIVRGIKAKKGRFLNKLDKNKIRSMGLNHEHLYEVVSDSVALEKTKQAIRYVHYKKEPANGKKSNSMSMERSFSSGDSQASSSSSSTDVDVDAQARVNGPAHKANAESKNKEQSSSDSSSFKNNKPTSPISPASVMNLNPGGLPPAPSIASSTPAPLSLAGMNPALLALLQTGNANALANLALVTAISNGGLNIHPTVLSLLLAQSANQATLSLARDMEAATNLSNLPKSVRAPPMVATKPATSLTKKVSPSA